MRPLERMMSMESWMSRAQFRGSWNMKIRRRGVVEKSVCCERNEGFKRVGMVREEQRQGRTIVEASSSDVRS